MRKVALPVAVAGLAGGALQIAWQSRFVQPDAPASPPTAGLDVIWFNLLQENPTPRDVLVRAILDSSADLVVLAEAGPLHAQLGELAAIYPWQMGCTGRRICNNLVLSRLPFAPGATEILPSNRPERLMHFALAPKAAEDTPALTVLAAHLAKPWFYGYVEDDRWFIHDRISAAPGPVLLLGDLNAAGWSRPVRALMAGTGLRGAALPVATWPVSAGRFGVPIDHMLVRGARLEDLRAWGGDLGSNHRGLRARVVWPVL